MSCEQRPPRAGADRRSAAAAEPRLVPPRPAAAAGWSSSGAAPPTAATPTTGWTSPAAANCWPRPAVRCIPGSADARRRPRAAGVRARQRCCSCARATAPARRWPKRCSSSCPTARSRRCSAGSHPKPLHPNAVRGDGDRGIDISGRASKHLDVFAGAALRLRDHAVRPGPGGVPRVPRRRRPIHWSIPDPAAEPAATTRPTRHSSAPPTSSTPASGSCSQPSTTSKRPRR